MIYGVTDALIDGRSQRKQEDSSFCPASQGWAEDLDDGKRASARSSSTCRCQRATARSLWRRWRSASKSAGGWTSPTTSRALEIPSSTQRPTEVSLASRPVGSGLRATLLLSFEGELNCMLRPEPRLFPCFSRHSGTRPILLGYWRFQDDTSIVFIRLNFRIISGLCRCAALVDGSRKVSLEHWLQVAEHVALGRLSQRQTDAAGMNVDEFEKVGHLAHGDRSTPLVLRPGMLLDLGQVFSYFVR